MTSRKLKAAAVLYITAALFCWSMRTLAEDQVPGHESALAAAQEEPPPKADAMERLFAKGMTPHLGVTGICMHIEKDGSNGSEGGECSYKTALTLEFDTEQAGLGKGGQISFMLETRQGPGITDRRLGDLFGVNNIEGRNFTQISEFWYQNTRPTGSYFKIGVMDTAAEFQALENTGDFINSSFAVIPNVPVPTFPDYAFSSVINAVVSDKLYVRAGVADGAASDSTSRMDTAFDNTFTALELGFSPFKPQETGTQSLFRFGYFNLTGASDSYDGADHNGNHGYYITGVVMATPNISSFIQYCVTPDDRNLFRSYTGAGFVFANISKSRPDDSMGLAYGNGVINSYSRAAGSGRGETVIELYYRMQLSRTWAVTPDIQWLKTPGGNGSNNTVYGLKTDYAF